SKDEILWRTFAHGSTILWVIGIVTAFLTATYMFRLVYMTFYGQRRAKADAHAADAHGHGAHDSHGHGANGGPTHDAPPAMAIVLVVLAIGSIVAGYVGIPEVLIHGGNRIEAFLEPSFQPPATAAVAAGVAEAAAHGETGTELLLMGVSIAVAVA